MPFTPSLLRPETAGWAARVGGRLVDVSADREAYWRLLVEAWDGTADLMVVEHDVLPPPGIVAELAGCPAEWCTCPYRVGGLMISRGLGCARFAAGLQARVPDAAVEAGVPAGEREPGRVWWALDHRLAGVLGRFGCVPHEHRAASHLQGGVSV